MAKVPRPTTRFNSSTKVLTAIVCVALLLSTTPLVTANNGKSEGWNWPVLFAQDHGRGSRQGAPAGVFPNMDEMRRMTDDRRRYGVGEPTIPAPIPSTLRRWRRGSQAAQPSSNVEVILNALIAFASPHSDTGIPWLTSRGSEAIYNPPIGLSFSSANALTPEYRTPVETAGIATSAAVLPQSPSNFAMARIAPQNRTGTPGVDLLSKNLNWSLGLVGLRGRSGLDLGLSLAYNSKVWTRTGNYIDFDLDEGTPAPGFRLGFPVVQGLYYSDHASTYFYMLITPAGQRIELRRLDTSNVYQTVDATYAQLTDNGSYLSFKADGFQLTLVPSGGEYHCTEVKDRNGNYLTITYNASGDILTITDTLSRVINFNYDGYANLLSITQTWGGQTRSWATFGYSLTPMGNNFPGITSYGPTNTSISTLWQVGLPDGSRYNFYYNSYGMVSEIRHHAADINNHERRRTTYVYDGSTSDCPRVTAQREWAENWNGDVSGDHAANEESVTSFGAEGSAGTMTLPNGVIYKEFYGTGWQAGLTTQTEVWSAGGRKKWTTYSWTQDNTGVSYLLNPRLTETNVRDDLSNLRRATIHYGPYEQYSLPYLVREYTGLDGNTPLRDTYTDYHLSQAYLDRRIIGLVSAVHVSNTAQWQTKVTYTYDEQTKIESLPAAATRHDPSYNTSFLTRGNVTAVTRWDVEDISNPAMGLTTQISYNTAGSVIRSTDPSNHSNNIFYNDSFSDGLNSRNTFAYPTFATDADGFLSYAHYNFDFGALTLTQGPPPAGQSQGAIKTMYYDAAGRLQWLINVNNSAWKYFAYADRGDAVMTQETINAAPPSYWSITGLDGADRVRAVGGDHPGSSGGYFGAFTYYDVMGRVSQQSNPAETTPGWAPTGDDLTAGWVHTSQTYDWQGRPLVTTYPSITGNPNETTTKEASYDGCGCAGGAVVTLLDEGTLDGGSPKRREQKIYSDVLGRTVKTEVRNWQGGTPYSATVNTYNARDQITQVRQYAGAEGSGTYQDTTMTYDGYGRVKTKHVPEQNAGTATTWGYNPDDTIQKITDARGSISNFSYNARHLTTGITYDPPAGITDTPDVSFGYDAAGNRTLMTDGHGSKSYVYDALSRLQSETRTITGLGSFQLSYLYNLAGQLTSITDPFSAQVVYSHDPSGRLLGITGSGFAGVSTYASGAKYRAWGTIRQLAYGNGLLLDVGYNARLQSNSFDVHSTSTSLLKSSYQYYSDGSLRTVDDQVNNLWDRAYAYDAAARMTSATAGPGTGGMPYYETFTHDAFNNLTNRMTELWSNGGENFNALYLSNRRQNDGGNTWQYDAAGNVLSITHPGSPGYQQYSIDAAGRPSQSMEHSRHTFGPQTSVITRDITIDENYDAAGQKLKRVETKTTQLNGGTPTTSQKITYDLRSSVLGGAVITELNAQGQKQRSNVFAAGGLLAVQQKDYQGNDQVLWSHTDPLTGSALQTNSSGQIDSAVSSQRLDLDPMGGAIPPTNPALDESSSIDGVMGGRGWYMAAADPFNPESGCAWDGMSTPCRNLGMIMRYLGINPKTTLPNFELEGGRDVPFGFKVTVVSREVRTKVGTTLVDLEDGEILDSWSSDSGTLVNEVFVKPNEIVIDLVNRTFADPDCFMFLKTVLNRASPKSNPVMRDGDIRDIFGDFLAQTKGGLSREKVKGAKYGSARGRIRPGGMGNAVIYRGFAASGSQDEYDAKGIVAELPHLAGSKGGWPRPEYHDLDLARGAYDTGHDEYWSLKSVENPFITFPDRRSQEKNRGSMIWSTYFHHIMNRFCSVPKG